MRQTNLLLSSENLPATEEISMPVFSERSLEVTRDQENATRRPIPVSTINWQTSITSHVVPLSGLDFLLDVNQLIIQQTIELNDLISNMPSENRYIIKVPRGETIYYATESSDSFQRTCFGSSRSFILRLYDPSQQVAIHFNRRLACGSCCSFSCYLQEMEVWIPPGEFLGLVKQNFNFFKPKFSIINKNNHIIYRIEGPQSNFGIYCWNQNENFQIYSGDGETQIGSIIHQWDHIQVEYNLHLQIPGNVQDTREKALLLGAAFLLEYMYFENFRRKSFFRCIC